MYSACPHEACVQMTKTMQKITVSVGGGSKGGQSIKGVSDKGTNLFCWTEVQDLKFKVKCERRAEAY